MHGLEADTAKESPDIKSFLYFLRATEKAVGGRPRGSKKMSEAEFREKYPEMYQELLDTYESKPRMYEVAEALGIHIDTLSKYQ